MADYQATQQMNTTEAAATLQKLKDNQTTLVPQMGQARYGRFIEALNKKLGVTSERSRRR